MTELGALVDHYRLEAVIGSGGFSTVYRAHDERLGADVAIKVLAENHALDPDIRERFLAEAQLLRRIECSAVVTVYDIGETSRSQPYIVMALAGGDLATRAELVRSATGEGANRHDALVIAQALTAGLGRAHRAGLVHRDVKPANLLLASQIDSVPAATNHFPTRLIRANERVLLSDFGFVKDLSMASGLTVGGGTEGFAAPEQRRARTTVDAKADVHGASAVIYWLFTGAPPIGGADDPQFVSRLPPPLLPVLRRGLAEEPSMRHCDMELWFEDVSRALDQAMTMIGGFWPVGASRSDDGGSPAPTPVMTPTPTATPIARRSRWVWGILAALVATAAAVTGVIGAQRLLDPTSTVAIDLDDNRRSITTERDDLTLTVIGPAAVGTGDEIRLTGSTNSASPIRWFVPGGENVGGDEVVLNALRPGVAVITAVVADADGNVMSLEFDVAVD